ncbi:MAG: hypothetical protein WED10_06190 [Brumimicrobium sp.]
MWSKLSFGAFFISLLSLLMMSTGFNPFELGFDTLFYFGVVFLGLLGFVFSILSNFFDKKRKRTSPVQSFIFYLGMMFIFVGVVFKHLHYPYTIHLLGAGIIISLLSIFIKVNPKDSENNDLLDD